MNASIFVLHAVQELMDAVDERLPEALTGSGLSKAQFNLMIHVVEDGPVRLSDLARYRRCVRSNVTYLARLMESEGLLSLTEDSEDRRARIVRATKKGLARYQLALEGVTRIEKKLHQILGADAKKFADLSLSGAAGLDAG